MINIFKLIKNAIQYRKLWKKWHKEFDDYVFIELEDKEHELLETVIKGV